MAHKFDRKRKNPYVEAEHQLEGHLYSEGKNYAAGAAEEIYSTLGDAIVTALGDVAAQAYRLGVNDPRQLKGLARAIAHVSEGVLSTYVGEVDAQAALEAMASDPRLATLTAEAQDSLRREIENTRRLEQLLLSARRIPDLIDYAGSLGLHMQEDALEEGPLLVQQHPAPPPASA